MVSALAKKRSKHLEVCTVLADMLSSICAIRSPEALFVDIMPIVVTGMIISTRKAATIFVSRLPEEMNFVRVDLRSARVAFRVTFNLSKKFFITPPEDIN